MNVTVPDVALLANAEVVQWVAVCVVRTGFNEAAGLIYCLQRFETKQKNHKRMRPHNFFMPNNYHTCSIYFEQSSKAILFLPDLN